MYQAMLGYGITHRFTSLTPRAGLQNPDDAFSTIPYEKGYQLLLYLESLDGEDKFQKFYNHWLTKWRYLSVSSDDFRQTFEEHLYSVWTNAQAKDIIKKIDWVKWLEGTGLPPITANFNTTDETTAIKLADDYIAGKGTVSPAGFEKYKTWPVNQKSIFFG